MIVRRLLDFGAAALLALPLLAAWRDPAVPLTLKLIGGVILLVTAVAPAVGLCLSAALLPLAFPIQIVTAAPMTGAVAAEFLALSFLTAAFVRLALWPSARSRLAVPAAILAALVIAGCVVEVSPAVRASISVGDYVTNLWTHVTRGYFGEPHPFESAHLALAWVIALAVAVTAERILRRDPASAISVVRLAILGGAGVAAFSVNRLIEVSIRTEHPLAMAVRVLSGIRVSPFYSDVNAAGSFLALFLVPAIWCAAAAKQHLLWIAAAPVALALWMAGSRAALIAAACGLAVAWFLSRPPARRWWTVPAVAALALAILIPSVARRGSSAASDAVAVRWELTRVSLRMAAIDPLFGIGLGRFRPTSGGYMTPELVKRFNLAAGENAHNNYLQILAELGPIGLAAFLWMLAVPFTGLRPPLSAFRSALAGGLAAFAITAILGHPLLIDHIRLCFFLVLGIAAGVDPPAATGDQSGRSLRNRLAIALGLIFIAGSLPFRVNARVSAMNLKDVVVGASEEKEAADGMIYRLAGRDAAWFVPGSAQAIELPLRADPASTAPCAAVIRVDGKTANVVTAGQEAWRQVAIPLREPSRAVSRRLDVHVQDAGCRLMVGRLVCIHDEAIKAEGTGQKAEVRNELTLVILHSGTDRRAATHHTFAFCLLLFALARSAVCACST